MSFRSHLVSWEEEYRDAGLAVIEINQSIGASLEAMRKMVVDKQLNHPVLWDPDCVNTKAYGITGWPVAFLIGVDGRVFWEGNPATWVRRDERVAELRALIEGELSKVDRRSSHSNSGQGDQ